MKHVPRFTATLNAAGVVANVIINAEKMKLVPYADIDQKSIATGLLLWATAFLRVTGHDKVTIPLAELEESVAIARRKHPVFATTFEEALAILLEEAGEIARAELENDPSALRAETIDFVVVLMRWGSDGLTITPQEVAPA